MTFEVLEQPLGVVPSSSSLGHYAIQLSPGRRSYGTGAFLIQASREWWSDLHHPREEPGDINIAIPEIDQAVFVALNPLKHRPLIGSREAALHEARGRRDAHAGCVG